MKSKKNREESPDIALESLSFEEALKRLEGIVDGLEQGDLELQDALGKFETGVALTRRCASQLDDAERRIEVLVKEGEKWLTRSLHTGDDVDDFDEEDEDDASEITD